MVAYFPFMHGEPDEIWERIQKRKNLERTVFEQWLGSLKVFKELSIDPTIDPLVVELVREASWSAWYARSKRESK